MFVGWCSLCVARCALSAVCRLMVVVCCLWLSVDYCVLRVRCFVVGCLMCVVVRCVLVGCCSLCVVCCSLFVVCCALLGVRCALFVVPCALIFVVSCL